MIHLLNLLFVPFVTTDARAASLDLDALHATRRASLLIRGRALDARETVDPTGASYAAKVDAYAKDDGFRKQMVANLSYLFRVRPPQEDGSATAMNTLTMQFDRLIRENRSWDELLTSKVLYIGKKSDFGDQASFYRGALSPGNRRRFDEAYGTQVSATLERAFGGDMSSGEAGYQQVPSTSPNVAGVLTDPAFLQRYLTNPINQNRKRAAAIYRIFLCDDMRAVALPDDRVNAELERLGLNDAGAADVAVSDDTRHADDPKCASCHFKLDDLAQVFRGQGTRLSRVTARGALNFRGRGGELVSLPFANAGELAAALVKQPEYASCQVRHFWTWFVGQDVPLSAATEAELLKQFDAVGRRPREFVTYLMKRREAVSFPQLTSDSITFAHVSGVLNQCTSCHETAKTAPDYRQLPIPRFGMTMEGDNVQRMHDYNVEALVTTMDLLGDGARATMPPANAGWRLATDDRARLLAWLAGGAKDQTGHPTWTNADLQNQVRTRIAAEKLNFSYRRTLGYTARRRMSIEQAKSTLANWLRGLGQNNSLDRPDYAATLGDQGAPVKIDSGLANVSPSAEYVRRLHELAEQVKQNLSWTTSMRRALGLSMLFPADDDVIQALTREIWGRAPDAREVAVLRAYYQGPGERSPNTLAARLVESENFVNY